MPRPAKILGVFIASPGDVIQERDIVADTVHEWNAEYFQTTDTFLHPIRWETHSHAALEGRPQSIINKTLLKDADLLIGIFRGRLGQRTGMFDSGSIEEIEECHRVNIPILLYFYDVPPVEPERGLLTQLFGGKDLSFQGRYADYQQLLLHRKRYEERGLVGKYKTIEEFQTLIRRHLRQVVAKLLAGPSSSTYALGTSP